MNLAIKLLVYIFSLYMAVDHMSLKPYSKILLALRAKDSSTGVTRMTVDSLVEDLGMNVTDEVNLVLARLAKEVLPAYERDNGDLTQKQLAALRKDADAHMPTGAEIGRESLIA